MDKLILDALFPPPPSQLVADLDLAGADGAAVYVWRPGGVGTWTSGHVVALRSAGKLAFPIIVPQPDGGDINGMLGAARSFGFEGGPITLDLEPPNLPPSSWEENFDSASAALGFEGFDYGTSADLGLYQPDDKSWLADWLRTGQLNPLPAIPPGRTGFQFVDDVTINGHQYDASMVAASVFGGDPMGLVGLDPNDPVVGELQKFVSDVEYALVVNEPPFTGPKGEVLLRLRSLSAPTLPADFATQVAAALVANTQFVDAMATAVAHKIGTALGNV